MTIRLFRAAGALLPLAAALFPAAARAQGTDARTLQRGWIEFRGAGIYQQFNSRFADGGSEPLGATFQAQLAPLVESLLAPALGPVRTNLDAFFSGTASQVDSPVTPDPVTGGTLAAELAHDFRRGAFSLAYGLTRRITVQATVPIDRVGTPVTALGLSGSNLGINEQAAANAAILAKINPAYAALGNSLLLPVSGTPAAVELQRRVKALAGDTLALPTAVASLSALLTESEFNAPLTTEDSLALTAVSRATQSYLGDIEVGVRFQFLNTTGGAHYALARPRGARAAVSLTARLPTGPKADTAFLLILPRQSGHAGVSAEVTGDLFPSERFWVTGSAGFAQLFGADVLRRPFSATRPFPNDTAPDISVRREPGARIGAMLLPRYRLTREITFAAGYRFDHQAATSYTSGDVDNVVLGPVERIDAWTAHSLSLGASYSTVEAFEAGRSRVPLEVSLLYHNSFAGGGYAPHAGTLEVVGRFLFQAFGRPRRARADTTAVDSAGRPLPPPPPPPTTPAGEPVAAPSAPPPAPPPQPVRPPAPPAAPAGEPVAAPSTPPPARPTQPARPPAAPPSAPPPAAPPSPPPAPAPTTPPTPPGTPTPGA
ncbi:MAG TPA: hypothetical protein VFS20_15090 [Longimicrobium sp.]|nr:hypothetical protein [Longimicrobium sp.]